ncbi:MAG: endonuclease/exonuclease/phosphatase family protein [Marinosulfonomonas sp.]|nr:endonuclease/exonuclease/phosphatase family protein [Marinosulfonomonas sp.]
MLQRKPIDPIETRLRVVSWNVWWQFGPWKERAPAILQTLRDLDADVIGLQEVWGDEATNFAAELAAELGYHHVYAPGAILNGVRMGNAILSRWPIARHEIISLYDQKNAEEMRVAIYADIDGPRGKIPMFCTHLNWQQPHSHIRQRQVSDLVNFVNQTRPWKFPPVICGDFNADPQSEEIRMMTGQTTCPVDNLVFHDSWDFSQQRGVGYTWDNSNPHVAETFEPDRRIDYIFVGWPQPDGFGHVADCQIVGNQPVDGVWPSDHFALLAELRY